MKTIAALTLLFAGCAGISPPPAPLSEILINPAAHDSANVKACGLLVDHLEQCSLWEHAGTPRKDTPGAFTLPTGRVWLSTPDESCAPGNPHPLSGNPSATMWVIVSGTFQTGRRYGHLEQSEHQILVKSVEPSTYLCGIASGT